MQGIYRITSPKGYVYIGQSWRLERRWIEHISDSKYGKMFVSRSIKKAGTDKNRLRPRRKREAALYFS